MAQQPAPPVFVDFNSRNALYWSRPVQFRVSLGSATGPWSDWSLPIASTRLEQGTEPVIGIEPFLPGTPVFFQRRLAPLLGEPSWTEEQTTQLTPVPGVSQPWFFGGPRPPTQYVTLSPGPVVDGLRQGFTFCINRNNKEVYSYTLPGTTANVEGLWGLDDLIKTVEAGFQIPPRNFRLKFTSQVGTPYLRAHLQPGSNYFNQGHANFRVLPYIAEPRQSFGPSWDRNGQNTLNITLGFGPVPLATTPQVSGIVGQSACWPFKASIQ